MALTSEDRIWLDDRFDRVFSIIEDNRNRGDARANEHSTKINAVSAAAVQAVSNHEREHHDPAKKWGVWASVVSVAGSIGAFFAWLFHKFGGEK